MGVDVSITDARCESNGSAKPGGASAKREVYKTDKYKPYYTKFEPFVVETLGRFGKRTREFFKELVQGVHEANPYISLDNLLHYWRSNNIIVMFKAQSQGIEDRWNECLIKHNGVRSSPIILGEAQNNQLATNSSVCA